MIPIRMHRQIPKLYIYLSEGTSFSICVFVPLISGCRYDFSTQVHTTSGECILGMVNIIKNHNSIQDIWILKLPKIARCNRTYLFQGPSCVVSSREIFAQMCWMENPSMVALFSAPRNSMNSQGPLEDARSYFTMQSSPKLFGDSNRITFCSPEAMIQIISPQRPVNKSSQCFFKWPWNMENSESDCMILIMGWQHKSSLYPPTVYNRLYS